jgi:hypothetical protein
LKIQRLFLSRLDAKGPLGGEEAFLGSSFTSAKKVAPESGKSSEEKLKVEGSRRFNRPILPKNELSQNDKN